ncbi:9828_t:CDS:2, partial [Entrophospora sp. SA101]
LHANINVNQNAESIINQAFVIDVLVNNVELLKKNKQSRKVNTEPKKSRLIDSITPTSRYPTRKPKTRKSNQIKTDSTKSRLVDLVRQQKAKPKTKKTTL